MDRVDLISRYVVPEPVNQMVREAYKMSQASEWNSNDPQFVGAAKVLGVAMLRCAIAGCIGFAITKKKWDPGMVTVGGALVSIPATAIYWGSRMLTKGVGMMYDLKQMGKGGLLYALGITLMNSHNYGRMRFGLWERFNPIDTSNFQYGNQRGY